MAGVPDIYFLDCMLPPQFDYVYNTPRTFVYVNRIFQQIYIVNKMKGVVVLRLEDMNFEF